jgi:deoxyribodipyrimidine photo-lyase
MGRPFHEKYAGVIWEDESEREAFTRWQEGRTGVPIVDAAMRCLKEMGWLHNRLRMIVAMYLTKDLLLDWRLGERVSYSSLSWCASLKLDRAVLHAKAR